MPNHYHLAITTPRADLSDGMHWLNSAYAHGFNEIHSFDGHLFQGRFHSVSVEKDGHLLELIRYLVLNPVRAGLCAYPSDWRWSSYRAMRGTADTWTVFDPRPTLSLFGRQLAESRHAFAAFVEDGRASAFGRDP
jgi:putative transposase